jgi:hypothetical protein
VLHVFSLALHCAGWLQGCAALLRDTQCPPVLCGASLLPTGPPQAGTVQAAPVRQHIDAASAALQDLAARRAGVKRSHEELTQE